LGKKFKEFEMKPCRGHSPKLFFAIWQDLAPKTCCVRLVHLTSCWCARSILKGLGCIEAEFLFIQFPMHLGFFFAPKTWVGEGSPENKCNFLTAIYDFKKIGFRVLTTLTIKITWIE
jgi:hypothetical protein